MVRPKNQSTNQMMSEGFREKKEEKAVKLSEKSSMNLSHVQHKQRGEFCGCFD